jgi:hypothetical protein
MAVRVIRTFIEVVPEPVATQRRSASAPPLGRSCPESERRLPPPLAKTRLPLSQFLGLDEPLSKKTTVTIRRLPSYFARDDLVRLLNEAGLAFAYDFVYMPLDFKTGRCYNYAIVNATHPYCVDILKCHFNGLVLDDERGCVVVWGESFQGLRGNVLAYRNSTLMHESVPDVCKPAVYDQGFRVAFPPPTVILRPPRARYGRAKKLRKCA